MIALGTILLVLPISSSTGESTSFVDALFTATSAVCVTGLVVVDTSGHWSAFGQVIILILIQVGGFGFMASATLFLLAFRRRIGLRERLIISESAGLTRLGGLLRLVKQMALFTLGIEGIRAMVFYFRFLSDNPPGTAVWEAIFHSVSAFNNAGFDLFGNFRSLSEYKAEPLVLLVTASLIILGGISYLLLVDLFRSRNLSKLSLDS